MDGRRKPSALSSSCDLHVAAVNKRSMYRLVQHRASHCHIVLCSSHCVWSAICHAMLYAYMSRFCTSVQSILR